MSEQQQSEIIEINNEYLNNDIKDENTDYITIILNRPLKNDLLSKIMKVTDILICADGGANRLYNLENQRDIITPQAIVGDLDSLKSNVRQFYESKNVEISYNQSQDDTDLEKSINFLIQKQFYQKNNDDGDVAQNKKKDNLRIMIIGGFGGRLDQTISNLSNLMKITRLFQQDEQKKYYKKSIIQMMDSYSLCTCLLPGEYSYQRAELFESNKGLGVLPLGNFNQGQIQTKGLKWELDGLQFEFGTFLSTSNEFDQNHQGSTYIKTDSTIFIMTSIINDNE